MYFGLFVAWVERGVGKGYLEHNCMDLIKRLHHDVGMVELNDGQASARVIDPVTVYRCW